MSIVFALNKYKLTMLFDKRAQQVAIVEYAAKCKNKKTSVAYRSYLFFVLFL